MPDAPDATIEVSVKMPQTLHAELLAFCAKFGLDFDTVVCREMKRWLLGQTIMLLEASGEDAETPPPDPRP